MADLSNNSFYLKKWYLDAANADTQVYIGYWAFLHWKNLNLHYYQHLWHSPDIGVQSCSHFSKVAEPSWCSPSELIWRPQNAELHWHSLADSLEEILLENEDGIIHWQCSQPKALASIQLPNLSFKAWGYTECIEMTIPVWKLPINTLYWGRSHSDKHSLVWIEWQGEKQQKLLWLDGQRYENLEIHPNEIVGANSQLKLGANMSLREGYIGSTVFRPFAAISQKFPEKVLGLYEQKWYNRGQLLSGGSSEKAISIYEKVQW